MLFDGNQLPTSLWIIAHGTPGHVKIGKHSIHVLDFVRLIKEWAGDSLQHVHIEACFSLQGVTTDEKKRKQIKDVIITGYDQIVGGYGVDIAQDFGRKLMTALSITVADCEPGTWTLNNMDLWNKVKVELQTQVGQPSRGQ